MGRKIGRNAGKTMEEYTLYLDESKNKEKTLFIISGIIVKNAEIDKLNAVVSDAKKCIWSEADIKSYHPVLHCVELSTIKDRRMDKKFLSAYCALHPEYSVFGKRTAKK